LDAGVYDYLTEKEPNDRLRTKDELKTWSVAGAEIVNQHPNYPESLMLELEGGRGCVRFCSGGCSFCSEPEFGEPKFRAPGDIIKEVNALGKLGITRFRLGAISCIFSYMADGIGKTDTPKPNPLMVKKLLTGIRKVVPKLKVFHLDNANPAVMAAHIKETKSILETIVENCTGGNVLSFGLESADPLVISANNLNTNPQEVLEMIKLVNKYGSIRSPMGLPALLPGLNFVYGLKGETKSTFDLNFNFLKSILAQGFMVRRINLRQVVFKSITSGDRKIIKKHRSKFIKHKKMVREQIDRPMLERMIPEGTVLKNALTEKHDGKTTFARQLGTYPILIGIPYMIPIGSFNDVVITDYGFRSVTGFSTPFNINTANEAALQALPGIGKKRAIRVLRSRPFKSSSELKSVLDDVSIIDNYKNHIKF
jgi:radical SAM superfamily enzyme with C-terminal helix-hairpin-helix motif